MTIAVRPVALGTFALDDGVVCHIYAGYARGPGGLWGVYQWLDWAPRGRNEERAAGAPLNEFGRHDGYNAE